MTIARAECDRRVLPATTDQLAADLDRHFTRRGRGLEFDMEAAWVRRQLVPEGMPLVDVGCGNGALLATLERRGSIGMDRCDAGVAVAARRFTEMRFACADAVRLPLADGSLGTMIAQHVIEHVVDVPAVLREWRRVLAPGGRIILLTPNRLFVDRSVFEDPTHVQLFDHLSLRRRIEAANFEILDLRTLGLPWFRRYGRIPSGWRLRRGVIRVAQPLSALPPWRWRGQTLCCVAQRPLAR